MALSVRDREAETIAREMARRRGVTITQIVSEALREKGRNDPQAGSGSVLVSEMMAIARRCGVRKVIDPRPSNESLGYDRHGGFENDAP